MTSKEALERLKFIADKELNIGLKSYKDLQEFWNYEEPLNCIEKLVERDTPMQPAIFNYREHRIEHIECRNGCEPFRERHKFCPHCGQRLDWSDDN